MDEALKKQIEEVTASSDPKGIMNKVFPIDESHPLFEHGRLLKVFRVCRQQRRDDEIIYEEIHVQLPNPSILRT